jgi:hypothetical protein
VVIQGIEAEGFRGNLHQFVADLHVRYGNALRDYDGNPEDLPNLQPWLAQLVIDIEGGPQAQPRRLTTGQRLALLGGSGLLILLIAAGCFYLRFTIALLPVAFPGPTATPTHTFTPTATATFTSSPTASATSTPIPDTPTPTATNTPTATFTPTFTPSPTPYRGYMMGNVRVYDDPNQLGQSNRYLLQETPVVVLAVNGDWALVEWIGDQGVQQGWVRLRWISLLTPLPNSMITPTVTR